MKELGLKWQGWNDAMVRDCDHAFASGVMSQLKAAAIRVWGVTLPGFRGLDPPCEVAVGAAELQTLGPLYTGFVWFLAEVCLAVPVYLAVVSCL